MPELKKNNNPADSGNKKDAGPQLVGDSTSNAAENSDDPLDPGTDFPEPIVKP
jgi:hypothetical protein